MMFIKKIYRDIEKYILGTNDFSYVGTNEKIPYPIDLGFTLEDESFYYDPKDEFGIPYKVYSSVGGQYNPTRVAAYALAHYNRYLEEGTEKFAKIFLKCADWFISNEKARYEYHFDWGNLNSPWISCMAQGEAASVLIRAYKLTNEQSYLEHAEKSLEPFFYSIIDGGVRSVLADGSFFLEEYPSISPTHVLNGYMYALIGLGEFVGISGNERHKSLFFDLTETLKNNIHIWCSSDWSLYDDPEKAGGKNFCTPSYHNLQISQLKWLMERVDSPEIESVIRSWEKGINSMMTRLKALFGKVHFRLKNKAQR